MGKKLAIIGHSTRGNEVIELLKMMGGNNKWLYDGSVGFVYFIEKNDKYITFCGKESIKNTGEYIIYELEEFLEKYPFKVGDKVIDTEDGCHGIVNEMKWDESVSDMKYFVVFGNGIDFGWFANDSIEFYKENKNLEEIQTKRDIDKVVDNLEKTSVKNHKMGPKSKLPSKYYEDRLEETQPKREYDELRMPLDDDDKLATEATIMGKKILPPDGYLVGKITQTENGMLVEYVNKKPKYPTTYVECCKTLDIRWEKNYTQGYKCGLISKFQELYIARSAFWKIAGEQMGLGKLWEPNWDDENEYKYGLFRLRNIIYKDSTSIIPTLLIFPTIEMRDAFYENFKDLIEACKEFL